ncbi:22625_t:CDS:1, partial [Racocetra persica]
SIQLIQEQEVIQVAYKQQDDEECKYKDEESEYNEGNDYIIQVSTTFTDWKYLESILKRYESEVGFKAIKFRIKRNSDRTI